MLDKILESTIINEIIFLTKPKIAYFYELYNRKIIFEDFVFLAFEVLESEHNFDNPINYKAQTKMFEELKSSKRCGIGKNLLSVQRKYNLNLEEMKDILIKVFKIYYANNVCEGLSLIEKVRN